jgi:hypothetical protein
MSVQRLLFGFETEGPAGALSQSGRMVVLTQFQNKLLNPQISN